MLKTPAQNNVRTSHCAMGRTCAHGDTPLHAPAHNLTPNRAFFCTHGASDWEPVHDLAPTSRSVSWCWGTRHGQQLPMLHMEVCSAPCNRDGLPMASSCMRQLLCVGNGGALTSALRDTVYKMQCLFCLDSEKRQLCLAVSPALQKEMIEPNHHFF